MNLDVERERERVHAKSMLLMSSPFSPSSGDFVCRARQVFIHLSQVRRLHDAFIWLSVQFPLPFSIDRWDEKRKKMKGDWLLIYLVLSLYFLFDRKSTSLGNWSKK